MREDARSVLGDIVLVHLGWFTLSLHQAIIGTALCIRPTHSMFRRGTTVGSTGGRNAELCLLASSVHQSPALRHDSDVNARGYAHASVPVGASAASRHG